MLQLGAHTWEDTNSFHALSGDHVGTHCGRIFLPQCVCYQLCGQLPKWHSTINLMWGLLRQFFRLALNSGDCIAHCAFWSAIWMHWCIYDPLADLQRKRLARTICNDQSSPIFQISVSFKIWEVQFAKGIVDGTGMPVSEELTGYLLWIVRSLDWCSYQDGWDLGLPPMKVQTLLELSTQSLKPLECQQKQRNVQSIAWEPKHIYKVK